MQYEPMKLIDLTEVLFDWPEYCRANNIRKCPMCVKTAHMFTTN